MPTRKFSAQELNHLRRFGSADIDTKTIGEKPVEYVTGHAKFHGLDFLVSPATLIPRIESEKIVDLACNFIKQKEIAHPVIADIGTGSGCLGLTLASLLSKEQIPYTVFLSDSSQEALNIAITNASRLLPSPANLFFEKSDLFETYPKIKFDIVMANLPYIPSKNIPILDSSVKNYEPISALDGGPNGTTLINRLVKILPQFLSPGGIAILEINDTHTSEVFSIPPNLTSKIEKDIFDVPRFLIIGLKQ